MSDAAASVTHLRAIRPKGPKIFVVFLVLAIIGGAAWWWTRPQGPRGAKEDPSKVLVVAVTDKPAGALEGYGFSLVHATLAELEQKAAGLSKAPSTGPAAALAVADEEGYGYVAFENPNALDFSGIAVRTDAPQITADQRWVVLSVGELGVPHKVTIGSDDAPLELPSWVELMRALFAQDMPANTLYAPGQVPTNAQELQRKIAPAIELLGAYSGVSSRARRFQRERDEALAATTNAPTWVQEPLEQGTARPLPDGGLLVFARAQVLEGVATSDVKLVESRAYQLWYRPADGGARQRCSSLRGGTSSSTDLLASRLFETVAFRGGDGYDVWKWDAQAGPCGFRRLGLLRDVDTDLVELRPSGRMLGVREAWNGQPLELLRWEPDGTPAIGLLVPGCTTHARPAIVDDDTAVFVCQGRVPDPDTGDTDTDTGDTGEPSGESGEADTGNTEADTGDTDGLNGEPEPVPVQLIVLVEMALGRSVIIPWTGEPAVSMHATLRPGGSGLRLLVHDDGARALRAIELPSAADLFARDLPVLTDVAVRETGRLRMEYLADDFDTDGKIAAMLQLGTGGEGWDIVMFDIDTGKEVHRIATAANVRYADPALSADGQQVVFTAVYDVADGLATIGAVAPAR